MASGVATTRLKKLHFTNWLNWNCESLVWVGGFVSGFPEFARCVAGICQFHHEQHVHDNITKHK